MLPRVIIARPARFRQKLERRHHSRVLESMKYLPVAFALVFVGTAAAKAESNIEFGEVRTRFEIRKELDAEQRLRPWEVDWRHTYAWQHGRSKRTSFAPPSCTVTRWVTTPSGRRLRELFIC
jgi:hypothetical protein